MIFFCFFFFSSRRRHTRCSRDWSSDVCSSDLIGGWLHRTFDLDIVFTWRAVVIAMMVMSFPLLVRAARVAFEEVNPRLEQIRSEERRVGKECRSRWSTYASRKDSTCTYDRKTV